MTITRTIKIGPERRPIGYYTWVATFRNGDQLIEFEATRDENGVETMHPQLSFDRVTERNDLSEVALIPYIPGDPRSHIRIRVAPGESVKKVFTRTFDRTFDTSLDDGSQAERAPIDTVVLISDKPIYHYAFHDGSIIITTDREP